MEALSIVLHKLRYSQRIRWARFPVGAASTDECGYRPILIGFNGLAAAHCQPFRASRRGSGRPVELFDRRTSRAPVW